MLTIKQIAKIAGVSRGTVDRVLNNRGGVSHQTEQLIRDIAKDGAYVPNKAGKTLSIKKRNLKFGVALLSSRRGNQFVKQIANGIHQKSCELADYGVTIELEETLMGSPQDQLDVLHLFVQKEIDGLIIMPEQDDGVREKLRDLAAMGIPVVTVNSDLTDAGRLAYVGGNDVEAGKIAAGMMNLVMGGTAQVGVVVGFMEMLCHAQRVRGFEHQAHTYYPGLRIADVVENLDDDFVSYEKTKQLLTRRPDINMLYVVAAGVFGTCRAVQDLKLTEKVKIICFDMNEGIADMLQKRVISVVVAQQPEKQAALALDVLFDFVAMDKAPQSEFVYTGNVIKIFDNLEL